MTKNDYFIPKEFLNFKEMSSFSTLSPGFYRSAIALLNNAKNQGSKYSNDVLSAVILFTTTIESYFNEILTLSLFKVKTEESKEFIEKLKLGLVSNSRLSFKQKIAAIFKAYDPNSKGIDTNGDTFQDLVALINLRNRIVHYNPNWYSIYKYPKELEILQSRCRIILENTGWTTNYSCIEVGEWADQTIRNIIIEFSRISGAENPFDQKNEVIYKIWTLNTLK